MKNENEGMLPNGTRYIKSNDLSKNCLPQAAKLSERPEREKVIGKQDIINLKIALETAKTIKEFFKLV